MNSDDITRDIEALEQEMASLRARADEDESTFSTLEGQVAQLRESLARTLEMVKGNELRLAEKHGELAQAKREEAAAAYKDDLELRREAADRVAQKAEDLLSELDSYDGVTLSVRRLMEDMREMEGNEERVAEMEADLREDPGELPLAWGRLVGAIKWRLETKVEEERVDGRPATENLPSDLQDAASARRRIKEYFGKD